jgi:hypothetical protein
MRSSGWKPDTYALREDCELRLGGPCRRTGSSRDHAGRELSNGRFALAAPTSRRCSVPTQRIARVRVPGGRAPPRLWAGPADGSEGGDREVGSPVPTPAGGYTPTAGPASTVRRGGQFQPNRSRGGGRGAGTSVGSPRWVRIFRMAAVLDGRHGLRQSNYAAPAAARATYGRGTGRSLSASAARPTLRVHPPTADHNWGKLRPGLLDVLANCGVPMRWHSGA